MFALKQGKWTTFNLDGNLSSIAQYDKGKRIGVYEMFHDNGKVQQLGTYVNGELDGDYLYYDSSGIQTDSLKYEMGEIITDPNAPAINLNDEEMPHFKGCEHIIDRDERTACGNQKMLEFIYGNIKYPPRARRLGVTGMAKATFVIEKDGSVSDVRVINGLNTDISAEVLRIINSMPAWVAGRQDGKYVRVQFNLPIRFNLE